MDQRRKELGVIWVLAWLVLSAATTALLCACLSLRDRQLPGSMPVVAGYPARHGADGLAPVPGDRSAHGERPAA